MKARQKIENIKGVTELMRNFQWVTQDVIDHLPQVKVLLREKDGNIYDLSSVLQVCHQMLLQRVLNDNITGELAFLLDLYSGSYEAILGSGWHVYLAHNPNALPMIEESPPFTLAFLHNHPDGSPFSFRDIQTFLVYDSLCVLTAIGNNGCVHVLIKQPDKTIDPGVVMWEYEQYRQSGLTMQKFLNECEKLGLEYIFEEELHEKQS